MSRHLPSRAIFRIGRAWGRALLAALAMAALPGVASAEPDRLVICVEAPEGQAGPGAALDRLVGTARVELTAPPCPSPGAGLHVGRFVADGRKVRFRLDGEAHQTIAREVPWLDGAGAPLVELERAGRLGLFSVMVEALLAERRLALAWAEALAEAAATSEAGPAASEAAPGRGGASAGLATRRRGPGGVSAERAAGPSGVGRAPGGESVSAGRSADPTGGSRVSAETSSDPSGASGVSADMATNPAGGGRISAETSTDPSGGSRVSAETSPDPSGASRDSAETFPDPSGGSRVSAETPANPSLGTALTPEAPPRGAAGEGPALAFQVGAGLRIRAPDFTATEVAFGMALGALYARGAWQPASNWELGGLAVSVEGLALEAGATLPVAVSDDVYLHLHGGLLAERVAVRALYRPDVDTHAAWDLGPLAGATAGMRAADAFTFALSAAAGWMPTARDTHIGTDGPSARLNAFSSRLGIELRWQL